VAALRLPRGKEELSMSLHAAASVLIPGGIVLVYGANDEGIRGAASVMNELSDRVETAATGGRCRVLKGVLKVDGRAVRDSLEEWRSEVALDHPHLPARWISYPGVFAHGRLDEGTRLLLDSLPTLPPKARVLDYGCGSGIVGYVALHRGEGVAVELLDVDSVALKAAADNVPGAVVRLHDGLPTPDEEPFDAIFSNPPFHRGKAEDPEMIVSLIRGAPGLLRQWGVLVFVAQRRLPLAKPLGEHFRAVEVLAEDSTYRVWEGRNPRKEAEGR
jgi:16S rRNA (guanine1207-N2)-methyltransferase